MITLKFSISDAILVQDTATFQQRLTVLNAAAHDFALDQIKHGIEREALRVSNSGGLAQTMHPVALGASLTNHYITTDFAEPLLEFITPPDCDVNVTLNQLADIHTFTIKHLQNEYLWPFSMPCFVGTEADIRLAEYGSSNIGQMKHLYRVGLKHRYGSMMQVISGVHFNFSLPDAFWQAWCEQEHLEYTQDNVSAAYFALIRNYRRTCWLIPYLFGASPALCASFLQGKDSPLPFKKLGQGTMYLPYATSLRMSDLGYTSAAQSTLNICYNHVDSYVASVREAIQTPSTLYQHIPAGEDQAYCQLNKNILQIENELYSPIRPKQITQPGEKPSEALAKRGVAYIEVRALDCDPFSTVGVNAEQIRFLDVYLLHCLLSASPDMTPEEYQQTEANLNKVVLSGRDPACTLSFGSAEKLLRDWANELFEELRAIADIFDNVHGSTLYTQAVAAQLAKVQNSDLTPSGRLLGQMLQTNTDNSVLGKALAKEHEQQLRQRSYIEFDETRLAQEAMRSITQKQDMERQDEPAFADFLKTYFAY